MKAKWSLKVRLLFMGLAIGAVIPVVGTFIYFTSQEAARINQVIATQKLAKTKLLGELVFKFRDVRLQVRTTPVRGMTWDKVDEYLSKTKEAVERFNATRKEFASRVEGEKEKALFAEFEKYTDEFLVFGGELIALASAHDSAKMDEVARQVRDICPQKASKVENAVNDLIELQSTETQMLVQNAASKNAQVNWAILLGSLGGFVFSVSVAAYVSRRISVELNQVAERLSESATVIANNAGLVSQNGRTLATSTSQQASSLQETVSAMEEISSTVQKNSENAKQSKQLTNESLQTAEQGREQIEGLINEVEEIKNSTHQLMKDVEQGNQEIGKIVGLIGEIESKTKIINDIVFQTKLLSFNASVEAARAGEAGKGFSVVAEEVGNLAAMSGKSAKEISELLASSVITVQEIVRKIQENVEKQGRASLQCVGRGIELGKRSGHSIGEILSGAKTVDDRVHEIAVASDEQSTGVGEVSKAMHQMDEATQSCAGISASSSKAADELAQEAQELKKMVSNLYATIRGADVDGSKAA